MSLTLSVGSYEGGMGSADRDGDKIYKRGDVLGVGGWYCGRDMGRDKIRRG